MLKNKARIWYRENKDDFSSWAKFKKLFRERFIGLLDEDDLYDELRMRIQTKNESMDEFVGTFRYMAGRLKHSLSTRELLKIAYKNLSKEYRQYINGREIDSFSTLLRYGREWEREKRLDERQSSLNGKRVEKAAGISDNTDKNTKTSKGSNKKGSKKTSQEDMPEENHSEIAAIDMDKPRGDQQKQVQAKPAPKGQSGQTFPRNNRQQQSSRQQPGSGARARQEAGPQHQGLQRQPQRFQTNTGTEGNQPGQNLVQAPPREVPSRNSAGVGQSNYRQAQRPSQTEEPNEQEVECYICNELGHKSWLCPTITCYKCNGQGHLATVCPSINNNLFCYKCGLAGVTSRNCPECNKYATQQGNE